VAPSQVNKSTGKVISVSKKAMPAGNSAGYQNLS
jgi:hypothetical protein